MEQLFGLAVFAVIAIISHIVSKAQEEAKRKQREQEGPTLRREDLPPDARRQLYGDEGDIPTARPRQAPPRRVPSAPLGPVGGPAAPWPTPPQRPAPRRAEGGFDPERSLEDEPSLEDGPSMESAPPPLPRRPVSPRRDDVPQPAQQQRPQPAQQRAQPAPQQRPQPPRRPPQQAQAPQRRPSPPAPQPSRQAMEEGVAVAQSAARSAPQPTPERVPQRAVAARAVFGNREDLRRAILAQEILGPPRSLRGFDTV